MKGDVVFGKENLLSSSGLASEVAALAASMGVQHKPDDAQPYSTDAFISAVKLVHDQLRTVHRQLEEKAERLASLEHELACREVAVAYRERKQDGIARLTEIVQPANPKRRWFT